MNTILTQLSAQRLKAHYAAGFWRDDTIYSVARAHADNCPGAPAFRDSHCQTSYAQLLSLADMLAADLHRRGVRPGQRVAVWLPGRLEVAVALLACSRNGYVICPSLHRDHTVDEVAGLLIRMRAAAFLYEEGYGADGKVTNAIERCAAVETLRQIYLFPPRNSAHPEVMPFSGMLDAPPTADGDPEPVLTPDSVVYLAFTSGTTGTPKGVMHSDNTLLANSRVFTDDWHIDASSVIYTMSPLSHNLGLGALINALLTGAELVVHDIPRGASLLNRLTESRASFLVGVPTHAIDLLAELRARNVAELRHLKGFRISGAAASGDVIAGLIAHGVRPQSGYGMTEAGSHNYTLPEDAPALITGSSGRSAPGYALKIWRQDDPDAEAGPGETGEIGGRGASLMLGYFDDQTATEDAFNRHGWFMTGDLGWVDENGYVRVTGRKKDLIIRGGHNIFPEKLEDRAMRHEAVQRAVAVPVPDERLGEKVCLVVMLHDGKTVTSDTILEHLAAAGLSKYDMPEYFVVLDELPLTSSGKILKRVLVDRIASGELSPEAVRWQKRAGGK